MLGAFVFLLVLSWAQMPSPPPAQKKPVSVSYEAILRCYPELEDSSQSFRVDLEKLKDRMDLLIPTLRTYMHSRTVKFRDSTGTDRRVRIEGSPLGKLSAQWETIGTDGVNTPWLDSGVKAQNPTVQEINAVLAKGSILADERIDVDTKIKDHTLRTRRNRGKVAELRLEAVKSQKNLSCEDKGEFGSTCLCTKKDAPAGK